jgi:hypothetical protein
LRVAPLPIAWVLCILSFGISKQSTFGYRWEAGSDDSRRRRLDEKRLEDTTSVLCGSANPSVWRCRFFVDGSPHVYHDRFWEVVVQPDDPTYSFGKLLRMPRPRPGLTEGCATRVQPIFEEKCVLCHNAEKFKGSLRLDSYQNLMRGGKDGPVIHRGEPGKSELFRRITLPRESKDFMPSEGKPALTAAQTKIVEVWITAGATPRIAETGIAGFPAFPNRNEVSSPLTPDYRPQIKTIAALEASLGVRLVPRSQNPTDGLILRTASTPEGCNDATLEQLAPVANLLVDAELARTKVTDKGLRTIATFSNLRFLDLSHTAVTSTGVNELAPLVKLESLNLTETRVTHHGIAEVQTKLGVKRIYLFETH